MAASALSCACLVGVSRLIASPASACASPAQSIKEKGKPKKTPPGRFRNQSMSTPGSQGWYGCGCKSANEKGMGVVSARGNKGKNTSVFALAASIDWNRPNARRPGTAPSKQPKERGGVDPQRCPCACACVHYCNSKAKRPQTRQRGVSILPRVADRPPFAHFQSTW